MKGKLVIEPYWNGYRPYYVTENKKILLHVGMPTKADAVKVGRMEIDYLKTIEGRCNNDK